ncbi:MAG: redoxin domain-containing protein [Verrucomicrobiota bacterium]
MTRSLILLLSAALISITTAAPPAVGDKVPALELADLDGKIVSLENILKKTPAVVVFLRGWNGKQCPLCSRQFGDFLTKAADFADQNYSVVFVYPDHDDKDATVEHATDFSKEVRLPENFYFLLDPGVTAGKDFNLFWDAKKETVYPSLFLLNQDGIVQFAKVSNSHGGRVSAKDALKEIENR